jgi:hypothetical protein
MTTVSVLEVFTVYSGPEKFFERENIVKKLTTDIMRSKCVILTGTLSRYRILRQMLIFCCNNIGKFSKVRLN